MTTKHRALSEANLQHVIVRGVAMQIIFEDDDDKRHFIKKLKQCLAEEKATEEEASLIAWCIMINHIHMLTKMDIEVLTRIMKRLLISYAKYFNARYDRVGPLFQGRFDNVAIESESQLLATVRYIHRNPLAIPGQTMESYPWSSYHEYLEAPIICDTEFVKSLFSSHDEFISFHKSWDIPEDAIP